VEDGVDPEGEKAATLEDGNSVEDAEVDVR
jgi:hypothetical protein